MLVFCLSSPINYTRDKVLNISYNVPRNSLSVFYYYDDWLNIVFGWAAALIKRLRMCRRGKWAGALLKPCQCGFWTALPEIHLDNLHSLPNKTNALLLLTRINKNFSNSAGLCFMETWLNGTIPDGVLYLLGYQLFRADCDTELTGKSLGSGTCFYINERWCTDVSA